VTRWGAAAYALPVRRPHTTAMSRSALILPAKLLPHLLWLCACSSCVSQSSEPVPLPTAPGILYGVVKDKHTDQPIAGAQILVVGTSIAAVSDQRGHYSLGPIPPGTYSVRVRSIGYSPLTTGIAISDSRPVRLDLDLAFPGVGPAVDSASWSTIWASALRYYHPQEGAHLREVAAITGIGHDSTNGPTAPLVLLPTSELRTNPFARRQLDSLVGLGLASGTCARTKAMDCPGTGFTTFLALGVPHQESGDTVTVSIEETAINVEACRNHRESIGGTRSAILQLLKRDHRWVTLGPTGISGAGTIICATH
jgi:hypothetical protein